MSQTIEVEMTLQEAAVRAQRELGLDLSGLWRTERPQYLSESQWDVVLTRGNELDSL